MPASSSPASEEVIAHIDGASRGNPGPAAYAVVLETSQSDRLTSFSDSIGTATNNVAEYQALLAALDYALEHQYLRLKVLTDSELLARQIQGAYKVRHPDLKTLYDAAQQKIPRFDAFRIQHVPREENREADRLCNKTLDRELKHEDTKTQSKGTCEEPNMARSTSSQAENSTARVAPLTVLTEEERIFQAMAREFAEKEILPHVERMDREGSFDLGLIDKFFAQGFMSIEIPETYGGSGGSFFMAILAVEEFSRVDASAGVIIDVQNTLVASALDRWGNEAQKRAYLPRLARDTVGAYALSESNAGSDAFALATRAREDGDHFILNGRKLWITNAKEAGLFIVFANVNPQLGHKGITAFLVERDTPGFSVGKKEDKLGIRASSTCELILEDCRVPKANVLGEIGKGYKVAIETLDEGRIGIGAQMIGVAQGALEHAIRYSKERKQFGKPIAQFQAVQFQLARMAMDVEAARLMTYNAVRLKEAGQPYLKEAAMAKLFCSEVAERVASEAVEVYGGYGFTKDHPVEKYLRDSKIGKIYEGTSFMQLQTIAKMILGN